eukprot:g1049.t1
MPLEGESARAARQHGAMEYTTPPVDLDAVRLERLSRIRAELKRRGLPAALFLDQINCRYATDATNMQIWCSHYEARSVFVAAEGPRRRRPTARRWPRDRLAAEAPPARGEAMSVRPKQGVLIPSPPPLQDGRWRALLRVRPLPSGNRGAPLILRSRRQAASRRTPAPAMRPASSRRRVRAARRAAPLRPG